jgi:protein TonB
MANHPVSLFDVPQAEPKRKWAGPTAQLPAVQSDIFLNALLEMPTTKQTRRRPLEWAAAMGLHIVIVAALIIVPLYTVGTIHLSSNDEVPLVAPPPLPPPPAGPAVASPHIVHPRTQSIDSVRRLTTLNSIPKRVSQENAGAAATAAAPDLDGVAGGVPGGVIGGELGGLVGGAFGNTGTAVPPPPQPQPAKRIVRAGSLLKAPRQTYNVDPEYPTLARDARIRGIVIVDAVIDEKGNVAQARVVSGHPLLIEAALKAVLQWKYEPTVLNGQPISVVLQVQVHFNLQS